MKTIGYVLSVFPVLSETFVGNEMRAMHKQGHCIAPIAIARPSEPFQPEDRALARDTAYLSDIGTGEALRFLATRPIGVLRGLDFILRQDGIRARSLLLLGAKVAVMAKRQGVEHLHAHFALQTAAAAIVAARLLDIPVSFVGHGYDVYATPADLALKLKYAHFAVAVCRDMVETFQTMQPAARVALIHCGVDVNRFQWVDHPGYGRPRLLFIGRLAEKKGLPDLLHALASLEPEARPEIHIVGDGPQRGAIEGLVGRLALHNDVWLLGAQPSQWLLEHASEYWGLVAPFCEAANGDRDTGPLVLKEAMALGMPVITTDFMGCREIVDVDVGFKVPPHDVGSLARAIATFITTPEERRHRMGKAARERVEAWFTAERQAAQLSTLVEGG